MKVSEIITELGRDFEKKFSIKEEPLFSKYKEAYNHFLLQDEKGLLILGSIGCGKSMMMKVLQRIFKDTDNRFKWVSSNDLTLLTEECKVSDILSMYGKSLLMDLYIDDIGIAKNKNNYGNVVNIISEIIFEREELFCSSGFRTHFSSNMIPTWHNEEVETLENIYGRRCYDRIKGMCKLISWEGKSLRYGI